MHPPLRLLDRPVRRAVPFAVAATVAALALGAVPASAHIEPNPSEAPAGSRPVVGFTIQHGCDGSPTVQVDIRIAGGVTEVEPQPVDGWTSEVVRDDEGETVTFVGGPLPDDEPLTVSIEMLLPDTPDTTIFFPTVQRCEEGQIRWIALPDGSGVEADEPAPAMKLTASAPAPPRPTTTPPTTSAAATTTTTAGEAHGSHGGGAATPDDTTAPSVGTDEGSVPEVTIADGEGDDEGDDDSSSAAPWLIGGLVVVVLAVGAVLYARSRGSTST